MKKTIYNFEKKYNIQNELIESGALEGLDERTLHETIKAMLINTIKDCIKYENWIDPDMSKISNLLFKENKTEEDIRQIKNIQDRLRHSAHLAKISEESLYILLHEMLSSEEIKECFKQEMPELYKNLYYMLDMEDDIAESLRDIFAELDEIPNYQDICVVMNVIIKDYIDNAEIYYEDIKDNDLYEQFKVFREKLSNKKKEKVNG